jgi:hypothetical protein
VVWNAPISETCENLGCAGDKAIQFLAGAVAFSPAYGNANNRTMRHPKYEPALMCEILGSKKEYKRLWRATE